MLIGYFYFGQGYSLASMVLLLPLYIKDELGVGDYSRAVTISAIIIIPWYLKVIFGVISDNFPISKFRRKPYLIFSTLFSAIGWLTIGNHPSVSILFITSGLSLAIGSAMADSVVDGIAVEITPPEFIGRLQGVAWGSRGLGIGITGIASSQIVDNYGWQQMFYISSVFGISISIGALFLPSVGSVFISNRRDRIKESFRILFSRSQAWNEVLFFLLTGIALCLIPLLTVIMDREFQFSIVEIGYGSLVFAIGSFIGAVINGVIFDKSETRKNVKLMFGSYCAALLAGLVFLVNNTFVLQLMYLLIVGGTAGAFEGYQLKIIQEATPKDFESTGFAVYTGISNIGQFAIGGVLIVFISEMLNISFFIPTTFVIACVIIAYLKLLRVKQLR